jgi:hypothetical protein
MGATPYGRIVILPRDTPMRDRGPFLTRKTYLDQPDRQAFRPD